MTGEEAGRLVAMLSAAYPRQPFGVETVSMYVRSICDLDYEQTLEAVERIVKEEEWPPTIARLRREVVESVIGLPSPEAAWENVTRRFGESQYSQGDKSIVFPEEVKAALTVAGVDAYRYWTAEDRSWLKRSFIQSYGAIHGRILRDANLTRHEAIEHIMREVGGTEAEAVRALEDAT